MRKLLNFKCLWLLCLMMTVQTAWAESYYPSSNYSRGSMVKNSSGDDVRYLSSYSNRIAITGSFYGGQWTFRNTDSQGRTIDPDWFVSSGSQTLSIMNLFEGDEVNIYYYNYNNAHPSIKNTGYVTSESGPWNSDGSRGCWGKMTKTGSMDFTIPANVHILHIDVTPASTNSRISFDLSGLGSNGNTNNYYRTQLSSRNFNEPALSVYPLTSNVSFEVTSYYSYNGAIIPVSTNYDASSEDLYKHEDHQVVTLNDNNNDAEDQDHSYVKLGDLLFKNIGFCKVKATANGQSAEYWVEVWDNEAMYEIINDNSKFKFIPNPDPELSDNTERGGVLQNRVITGVNGMTMTIGNPYNNSVVVSYQESNQEGHREGHMVSFSNATNGWWDRWPYSVWWPTEGTYYQFEATANGTLKIGGIKQHTGGNVYLVDRNNPYGIHPEIFSESSIGYLESDGIPMNAGTIYYIHGRAETGHWGNFTLEWFSFETDLSLSQNYGVSAQTGYELGNGGTVTSFATTNATGVYDVKYKGSITSATVTVEGGRIKFSNIQFNQSEDGKMGGAIKVKVGNAENNTREFVLTIPYGKHVWDFRNTTSTADVEKGANSTDGIQYTAQKLVADMRANNADDWSRVYKVHRRINGAWVELKTPIMAVRSNMDGDNAFYMTNTNGLVVDANAECFGAEEDESMNMTSGYSSLTEDQRYNLDYTTIGGTDNMWLHTAYAEDMSQTKYSKILFPGVKANQYIKIYCHRHAPGKGETYTTENLVDLTGNEINSNFIITGTVFEGSKQLRGNIIFRVPADYEPTDDLSKIPALILKDDGWTRFFQIEITDVYSSDLRSYLLSKVEDGITVKSNISGMVCNDNSSVVYKNNASLTLQGYGQTYIQNAWSPQFTVIKPEGSTVTYTSSMSTGSHDGNNWRNLQIDITGGQGNLLVLQEMMTGGYVLDRSECWFAISQYHPQTFPYTWDFTARNMSNPWNVTGFNRATTSDDTTPYARIETTNSVKNYGQWGWGQDGSHKIMHFVGEDYQSNYTATRNDDASRPGETYTVSVSDADLFNYGSTDDQKHAQVVRPLFANGGELTYGATTLKETEGLRFELPRVGVDFFTTAEDFAEDGKYASYNGSLEMSDQGSLNISRAVKKEDLTNNVPATTIYIPEVDQGMYIFVQASKEPTVTNAEAVDANDEFKKYVGEGVYVYKKTTAPAKAGDKNEDVALRFSNTTSIYKIGVTDIRKSINELGYATESRNHAIDHTYTGDFTSNDVNAYGIEAYGDEGSVYDYKGYAVVHKSENEVTVIPEQTGTVLYKANHSGDRFECPLFYPACNVVPSVQDNTTLSTNWMAPNVEAKQHYSETIQYNTAMGHGTNDEWCTKFIMSRQYYTYYKNDGSSSEQQTSEVEAFYRMRLSNSEDDVLGANKAYLLIPNSKMPTALWNGGDGNGNPGSSNIIYIDLEDVDEQLGTDTTDIAGVETVDTTQPNVYYTLSGIKLNDKPSVKGIYLCNGKKVYVK